MQGFLEDAWTGPQILAHHLLKVGPDINRDRPTFGVANFQ
jgi:hypothetical protein